MYVYKIVLFTISTIYLQPVFSLKCYDCAGPLNEGLACEIDLGKEQHAACTDDQVCVKFLVNYQGKSIMNRRCEIRNICQQLDLKISQNITQEMSECEICETDYCNSSPHLMPSISIITILLSIITYQIIVN